MKQQVSLLFGFVLVACGGGGGGGDNGAGGGGGFTTSEQIAQIGDQIDISGTYFTIWDPDSRDSFTAYSVGSGFNGAAYLSGYVSSQHVRVFVGFRGLSVSAVGASNVNLSNPSDDYSGIGIEGEPASSLPQGQVIYIGHYDIAHPFVGNSGDTSIYAMDYLVDFNALTLTGNSYRAVGLVAPVSVVGTIDQNTLDLEITDGFGTHQAEGGFYGENGEEFAAGFVEGDLVGLIYGEVYD